MISACRFDVKLVENQGNSGIQFRSEALPDGEMRGYQADIGVGWWGKLYEENRRGLLSEEVGRKAREARAIGTTTRSRPSEIAFAPGSTAIRAST